MRLTDLEVIPIAIPFRETYRTASGELGARSMLIVRLWTDKEQLGIGEAVPLSLRGGATVSAVAGELSEAGAVLRGLDAAPLCSDDLAQIRAWLTQAHVRCRSRRIGPQATAAVDVALHDLAGRLSGLPLWRLLGATETREVPCNATLDAGEPDDVARLAAEQRAAGFSTHKIKVGRGADAERVAAVRAAVGDQARIRLDANGAWTVETAVRTLGEMGAEGVELAEQPCRFLPELAAVRAQVPFPVVADESVASLADAEDARRVRACDAATLKLAKVGGPLEALRIAARIPSYLSSALDGPIGIAAAVHTAQALPVDGPAAGLAHGLATLGMFSSSYGPAEGLLGPVLAASHAPGLGVEIDERRLEELRVR